MPPYDAAELVIDDMYSLTENLPLSLSGQRYRPTTHLEDKDLSRRDFQGVYEEVADWLPVGEPEIRVYLGSNVLERFITSEYELTPEVLEALAELQGDIYKQFGITKDVLGNTMRWLQENKNEVVRAELVAGLDNILLKEQVTSIDVLDLM